MATELVQKNRKAISVYCTALRITGWLLIVGSPVLGMYQFIEYRMGYQITVYLLLPKLVVGQLFPGVFALGLAQLIRYIFENEYKPGRLLQYAHIIMCVYSILLLISVILHYSYVMKRGSLPEWYWSTAMIILTVVKVFIPIGIAGILRRVMPIIAESKTLV